MSSSVSISRYPVAESLNRLPSKTARLKRTVPVSNNKNKKNRTSATKIGATSKKLRRTNNRKKNYINNRNNNERIINEILMFDSNSNINTNNEF